MSFYLNVHRMNSFQQPVYSLTAWTVSSSFLSSCQFWLTDCWRFLSDTHLLTLLLIRKIFYFLKKWHVYFMMSFGLHDKTSINFLLKVTQSPNMVLLPCSSPGFLLKRDVDVGNDTLKYHFTSRCVQSQKGTWFLKLMPILSSTKYWYGYISRYKHNFTMTPPNVFYLVNWRQRHVKKAV